MWTENFFESPYASASPASIDVPSMPLDPLLGLLPDGFLNPLDDKFLAELCGSGATTPQNASGPLHMGGNAVGVASPNISRSGSPTSQTTKPIQPAPIAAAAPSALAPVTAALLPFLNKLGGTPMTPLDPTVLATVASAAGVPVQQLQQQLQSLMEAQARQTPTVVKSTLQLTPPYSVGRKRKERPADAQAILAELDMKRQKNTEAARRSRARKMERMSELEGQVKELESERDDLKSKVVELEVEKDRMSSQFAKMQQRLKMFESAFRAAGIPLQS
ncbi:hypothetical protein BC832DRAFT_551992 [Gaertneriomyces semiglobifer]|nr:hypothetical protein BC832DRAFT_551992 [Gaertneriomyces semiglobifer]